ncbi:MAG: recombinase family protein [Nitrospira sp.]
MHCTGTVRDGTVLHLSSPNRLRGRCRIAAQLTKRGIPTRTGFVWSPQTVASILRRAKAHRPTNNGY